MVNEESIERIGPYIGLRPYEESNQDIFFGREEEREIIIDKLIANKLTLLFAASGVGKSSLLRAAVLPGLKQMKKENPDVVYYCDWVSDPLEHLKRETVRILREQKRVAEDYAVYREDEETSLKKFFRLCAIFAGEPLVVILDQFEEFFQYRRYKENFIKFIEEFSECIRDSETPVVFLISMREDFALELNAFKKYLPTILFENYFRLEKLTEEKAREAIVKPLEPFGFHYEEKLLETLLKDLAQREKETQLGVSPEALVKDMPAYVEPPYLQIVCSRLWETDQNDPEWTIREGSYNKLGRDRGIVDSYFHEVMDRFSRSEKKIASSAFDLLITPRGTKIAYPLEDLKASTGVDEKDLENVLEKLRISWILRSQKREGAIWYELYHDIFSNIINHWNDKFKSKQRIKRASFLAAMAILVFLVLFIIYDIISNTTGHYLRLSVKETISDRIEVYRGNLKSPNIFGLHEYQAETSFERDQVEPDKLFGEKQIGDFDLLDRELIGHLPLTGRISAYWEAGEIGKAFELVKNSISENEMARSRQAIGLLPEFGSIKSYRLLKELLDKPDIIYLRKEIIDAMALMPPPLIIKDFIGLLYDESEDMPQIGISHLGQIGDVQAVPPLLQLLKSPYFELRGSMAEALGRLGSEKAVPELLQLLKYPVSDVKSNAAEALGQIGSEQAVPALGKLLKDPDNKVRCSTARALCWIGSEQAVVYLLQLLKDPESNVRSSAAEALGRLGSEKALPDLLQLLKDPEFNVRSSAAKALGRLGSEKAVPDLLQLLYDPESNVKSNAAKVLGQIGSEQAVPYLLQLLNYPVLDVKSNAAEALGQIGSEQAVPDLLRLLKYSNYYVNSDAVEVLDRIGSDKAVDPLIGMLKDLDDNMRSSAAEALGRLGSEKALPDLLQLLKDPESNVRSSAAEALGRLGSEKAVPDLLQLLKDAESDVRSYAAEALGRLGSEKAVPVLLQLLKDPEKDVRYATILNLGELGSAQAMVPLLQQIKDPDEYVRVSAAIALGWFGSEKGVLPLLQMFKDPKSAVRSRAASAIGALGSEQAVTPLLQLLRDMDKDVRGSAAEALGVLSSEKAVDPLIVLLKDPEFDVRSRTAAALGTLGSAKAIGTLVALLNNSDPDMRRIAVLSLGKLSAGEKTTNIKTLYTNKNEKPIVRLAVAATLLKWGDESGLEYLKEISNLDKINRKIELAKALGEVPSKPGNSILIEMLAEENIRLKEVVISSLGKTKDKSYLPDLHPLSQYPNTRAREAVVTALAEIAAQESIAPLKKVAMKNGERISTRVKAIIGLNKIQHQDALQALMELLDNENDVIQYKTIMAIGKTPPSPTIPGPFTDRLKSRLKDKLTGLEKRKAAWRKIRDEDTNSYNEEKLKDWNQRLNAVEPREALEFELAFALSRIDPFHEGIRLLGHDLANVREGAWMGVGKSRDVSLIEKLYWQRKQSDIPWFIHAAYRAMDHILTGIEAFGRKEELNRLQDLYKSLSGKEGKNFHEGVQTRMEWTIDRLKERLTQNN